MAITYDNSAIIQSAGSNVLTTSYTTSGSDRLIFVCTSLGSGLTVSSVTYNSVALTELSPNQDLGGATFYQNKMFYLVNPASGANNLVVTASGSGFIFGGVSSYNGVHQTSPISPATGANAANSGITTLSASITTDVDGSWIIGGANFAESDKTFSAGANTTVRANTTWDCMFDSGSSLTPTGSKTLTINSSASAKYGMLMIAISPASFSSSSIKTVNGLAKASVKTYNGLAIASVKNINGLA